MKINFRHLLLIAIIALLGTAAQAEVEVRTLTQKFAINDATQVDIDITIGDISVQGSDDNFVSVDVTLECNRQNLDVCQRRANRLFLSPRLTNKRLDIRLRGTPRGHLQGIRAHMVVSVPKQMELEIDTRTADVTISGMTGNIEVDGVEGSVGITASQSDIREVSAKVGAGQVDLWVDGARIEGSGFPRSVKWQGSGSSEIELDLAAGDVDINLN